MIMITSAAFTWVAVARAVIAVPLLVIGLVAVIRARPADLPAVLDALSRWFPHRPAHDCVAMQPRTGSTAAAGQRRRTNPRSVN